MNGGLVLAQVNRTGWRANRPGHFDQEQNAFRAMPEGGVDLAAQVSEDATDPNRCVLKTKFA